MLHENRQSLMGLILKAECHTIQPAECQLLREAVELLDEMAMMLEGLTYGTGGMLLKGYSPTSTQEMRLDDIRKMLDDNAPGRP